MLQLWPRRVLSFGSYVPLTYSYPGRLKKIFFCTLPSVLTPQFALGLSCIYLDSVLESAVSHFCKHPWFLLLENAVENRILVLGHPLLLGCDCFYALIASGFIIFSNYRRWSILSLQVVSFYFWNCHKKCWIHIFYPQCLNLSIFFSLPFYVTFWWISSHFFFDNLSISCASDLFKFFTDIYFQL